MSTRHILCINCCSNTHVLLAFLSSRCFVCCRGSPYFLVPIEIC